jgi:peptidoglycan/LPS O-acetylase OafA/YrhL
MTRSVRKCRPFAKVPGNGFVTTLAGSEENISGLAHREKSPTRRQYAEALPYRRDIDGLRALAVLAVIAYHSFPDAVTGGFVGVDVFFVISGFLISSIIGDGLKSGAFSLRGFYAARIRRIFPALITVLGAVGLFGWYALLDSEYQQLGKHITAGAGFVSNLALWSESGYFDTDSALKPLLHLWSLGIEEQFYLFWPLIMWTAFKRSNGLMTVTVIIIALSFLFGLNLIHSDPVGAFYLPTARAWELLIGALLSYFRSGVSVGNSGSQVTAGPRREPINPSLISWFGLLCILAAIFTLDREVDYPGWLALLPTLGAAALIFAGPSAWPNRRILGNRLAVAIGLISYPLYLWHWPLLSFLRIIEPDATSAHRLVAVAMSFVLAWLTFRLVELPIRKKRAKPVALSFLMIVVAIIGYFCWSGGLKPWSASFGLEKIVNAPSQPDFPGVRLKPFGFNGREFFHQGGTARNTLFVGDSNVEQYYARIDKLLTEHPGTSRGIVYASSPGCPPIPNIRENNRRHWCYAFMKEAYEYSKDKSIDTVVIAANWYLYFSNSDPIFQYVYETDGKQGALGVGSAGSEKAYEELRKDISDLVHQGKKVYLVLNIPTGEELAPSNLVQRSLSRGFQIKESHFDRKRFVEMTGPVMLKLKEAATAGGATVINPVDVLCGDVVCPALTPDGRPIYRDKSHLRYEYVREHITFLDEAVPM